MKLLCVNAGSSSLKFQLFEMPEEKVLISGYIEKIGFEDSFWNTKINGEKIRGEKYLKNHTEAVDVMLDELLKHHAVESLDEIKGVGHRVLHGGEKYSDSVLIDDTVVQDIKDLTKLGPLHHPGNLAGIAAMQKALPNVPNVAVFDTAFHQTMPAVNYMYPVPYEWYEKYGVRKYGFHGTSHKYITETMKKMLGKDDVNLIICHVGSGASISCIKDGKCYDTTMGLTPLDGLMMGTRCGSIDPSIIETVIKMSHFYFMQNAAYKGIDLILFSNPKFLVENLIAYLGLNSSMYIFKLTDFTLLPLFTGINLKKTPLFTGTILK